MYVVTIEKEVDDDFFGHWEQCVAYILNSPGAEQSLYEALYRWIKTFYHGSTEECQAALNIEDRTLRVTTSHGFPPGTLVTALQIWFVPLDCWAGGRRVNATPAHCAICDWYGPMCSMEHRYTLNSRSEIEPLDRCPECNTVMGT